MLTLVALASQPIANAEDLPIDGKFGRTAASNDGRTSGYYLWRLTDPNHVIYLASPEGASPTGASPASGHWNSGHRLRFRTYGPGQGFLFENSFEQPLFDMDAGNGDIWLKGKIHSVSTSDNYLAGRLGIGTNSPTHELSVNGTIQAKEVIVETGWSDFVFEKAYKLRTLDEVESHIQEHGHLPDVPSASVVESEGLSLGEAQKIMMQKIEELTLYVIDLKKENEALKAEVEKLKAN